VTEKIIKRAEVPEVNSIDIIFPTKLPEFDRLLKEAENEGLEFMGNNKWEKLFSTLFYNGGKIPINKKLDEKYREKVLCYFKMCAGAYCIKHEHKTIVCAYLLRSICA